MDKISNLTISLINSELTSEAMKDGYIEFLQTSFPLFLQDS